MPAVDSPTAAGRNTATWNLSEAQAESYAFTDAANYVSCTLTPSGLLELSAGDTAGGDTNATLRIDPYTGPGPYDMVYSAGGGGGSVEIRLAGGYAYWFSSDYSEIDFRERLSTCINTINETTPGARISADIYCDRLVAQITSPDYDLRDAEGFRPHVTLVANFVCDL
jgi:hypothetical protein